MQIGLAKFLLDFDVPSDYSVEARYDPWGLDILVLESPCGAHKITIEFHISINTEELILWRTQYKTDGLLNRSISEGPAFIEFNLEGKLFKKIYAVDGQQVIVESLTGGI